MALKPIDHYFAAKFLPVGPSFDFLAHLLQKAREGHLCVAMSSLDPHLLEGAERLPEELIGEIVHKEGDRIYLMRNWVGEQTFLRELNRLKGAPPKIEIKNLDLTGEGLEAEQKAAIHHAANASLSLICGGPGTGKTYTAKKMIEHFLPTVGRRIVVAAPTGKATANLRRHLSSFCPVQTLHKLLQKRYLPDDLIVVDEASMIDAELMARLFTAVKTGARLILLGDPDQLPPVESGHFFVDLACDEPLVSSLTTCLRTELQEIVDLAAAVKRGEKIHHEPLPSYEEIAEAVFERKETLLTPMRHGPFGVHRLNRFLHERDLGSRLPIMITVNKPDLDLYNGDIGVHDLEKRVAYFGKREISEYLLPKHEYAYAMSVHKSQGSEYDHVRVLVPEGSEVFGKEMLYTAITRAKKGIRIHADEGVIEAVVKQKTERFSGLKSVNR